MRILLVNWQDRKNPLSGGAEIHLHEIFGRIAGWGHEVTLLCSSFEGGTRRDLVDGIQVIRTGRRHDFNFHVPFASRVISKQGYDILVDNINKIPFFSPLYTKIPILTIGYHFFGPVIYQETNPLFASYVFLTEKLVPWIYRKQVFSVLSESTKSDLRGVQEANIHVISPAISPMFVPNPGRKSGSPLIVSVGRIKKYKCVDALIRAMKNVVLRFPDARLVIAGTGDYLPQLVTLSDKLKLTGHIEFVGFISEEKKIELLQSATVFVNPSPKEGWGITSIEANACGTPVIASDSPGLRDSVVDGETGFLVEHGSTGQLSDMIIRVIENKELTETLSRNAIQWAKRFSWDDAARRTLDLMTDIILSRSC
jgi:glycosyltransferase involved in cell wall biosynthesis